MKTVAIIQARMGSSRLPGKVMMKLDEKNPAIYYVIKQLQSCKFLDEIIIATSILERDNPIVEFVKKMNVPTFRGDEQNCLDRYYQCAKKFDADVIVRIPADKPLIDPNLVDVSKFSKKKYDYVSNWLSESVPNGTEVEAMTFSALEQTWKNATTVYHKEHVTPYIYEHPKEFKILSIKYKKYFLDVKYALDTKEDYELIKSIIKKIKKRPILTEDILQVLNSS